LIARRAIEIEEGSRPASLYRSYPNPYGVSGDGNTVVGVMMLQSGQVHAFIARVGPAL
jgi:uncharacterized membrane protein